MALVSGDRLGPYKIERLLGAGGMGEVYQGVDTRLGRAVALKVISPRLVGDEASRRRFETEARSASALNHPAIVTLYDIGESDGLSWMAMELVEGCTLRDAIAAAPIPIRQAWSIARQLAEGLAVAHAKGIVHRDLKPENVMLAHEGGVKILDFGLARQSVAPTLDAAPGATVTDVGTVAGTILGTVGYMSPEQATGREADFRSDQFSLGAVIYELLTGQRAFSRPTSVETLSAILRDEPPPLTAIRRDASDSFQRVISRCLEKRPADRFASTRELAAALEALTPESSGATVPTDTARLDRTAAVPARRWWSKLRVALAAVVIAAVAAGGYFWNRWDSAGSTAITSVAVLPFENSAQDPEVEFIAEGLTDGLIDHLDRAKSLRVMARATVMRFKEERDLQKILAALKVGAVVTGRVSRRGDQIVITAELIHGTTGQRLWGQAFDQPVTALMRVQDRIVLSIAEGLQLRLSGEERARLGGFGTDNPEAYELFLKARFLMQRDTVEDDLEARKLFEQAAQKDPNFLDAHLGVASTHARSASSGLQPPREAAALGDAALAKAAAIDSTNVAVRVAMAGRRFAATRDWAATEREYRALMYERAVLRSVHYHPIALFFVACGRTHEAVALVERALVVDPDNLESKVMLGIFLLYDGRLDDALRVYDGIAAEAPNDRRPLFGKADVYKRRGAFALASQARRKAYELSGDEDAARAFASAATEAEFTKAELTVARRDLREMEEARASGQYVEPFDIARLYAQVGNEEQALAGLERAVDDQYIGLILLKVDEAWESVRADPRFAAVVRRVGIP